MYHLSNLISRAGRIASLKKAGITEKEIDILVKDYMSIPVLLVDDRFYLRFRIGQKVQHKDGRKGVVVGALFVEKEEFPSYPKYIVDAGDEVFDVETEDLIYIKIPLS